MVLMHQRLTTLASLYTWLCSSGKDWKRKGRVRKKRERVKEKGKAVTAVP